jgi:ABC-type glycerol-3-phosphate transport system substrate-binding protein
MAGPNRSNSLILWMLKRPGERLFAGFALPILVLAAFVGALLVDFRAEEDVVFYRPDSGEVRSGSARAVVGFEVRTKITYWEKWSGFEGQAIQDAVDHFNKTNKKGIYVELVVQGDIQEKIKIATAGGDPPDIAGLYNVDVPVFASQNALLPLDEMMRKAGIRNDRWVKAYIDLCVYRGQTWAIPSVPSTWALHWNKKLFREAGLDPEKPPRTITELNEFARKLTRVDKDGKLIQVGYLPTEPGWWKYPWGYWFGGRLWNGTDAFTFNSPENLEAMQWIRSYADGTVFRGVGPKPITYAELDRFKKTFGGFSSVDNAFFTGKVAMEIQGVWMAKFVDKYAPGGFEYGVAPFPAKAAINAPGRPILRGVSVAEADVIGIPRGARHVEEAFEFIKFMSSPEGVEILCLGQGKHSPLKETSPGWHKNHPNPYVRVFEELAASPNCFQIPQVGVWRECNRAWGRAFDAVWAGEKEPKEALDDLQKQMQRRLEQELRRQKARQVREGS